MIINNSKIPEEIADYLRLRGVPRTFFSQARFKLEDHIQRFQYDNGSGKVSSIAPDAQLKAFERTAKKPLERPYLYVIATNHNEIRAGAVALSIFESIARKQILDSTQATSGTPYWHSVTGNKAWDRLRDHEGSRAQVGDINLLVISNIAENSTNEKIEKVRDLNYKYIDIPRIIIVAGCNPLQFAYDKLRIRPDRMLYLTERKAIMS